MELLKDTNLERPGAHLLNLIISAANARRLTVEQMASEALGVSASYFRSLRNGFKDVRQLTPDRIARAAKFLGMSKISAMLAADQLAYADFYAQPELLNHYLRPALSWIQSDPEWAAFMPARINEMEEKYLLLVVMLYERATGRTLIPGRVSEEEIVRRQRDLPRTSKRDKGGN